MVFSKNIVLKNFASFLIKACNFIKKESLAQVFSCEFCEIFKNTYFYRTPPMATTVDNISIYGKSLNDLDLVAL